MGKDYQPASPELLAAGWQAGMPHRPLDARVRGTPLDARVRGTPCGAAVAGAAVAVAGGPANGRSRAGTTHEGAWQALLRASGRLPR